MFFEQADIVIIGGGAMGLSCAYQLSKNSCQRIVVIEREPYLGGHTTSRCAGGFRYQYSSELNIKLSLLSYHLLTEMQQEGLRLNIRPCGYMFLLDAEQEIKFYQTAVELQKSLGINTEMLSKAELKRHLPMLNTKDILEATYFQKDGLINVHDVINFYAEKSKKKNVHFYTNTEVVGAGLKEDGMHEIMTSKGNILTRIVIIAAGPWSGKIGSLYHLNLPITPVKQQIFITDRVGLLKDDFPVVLYMQEGLGFHKEGEGILSEMSRPLTTVVKEESRYAEVDLAWELLHCKQAIYRFPALSSCRIINRWAGYYEMTPDENPIIGPIDSVKGLYCVAGFNGHGFMHSPACGLLMKEWILEGASHTLNISPFLNQRFYSDILTKKEMLGF
ncbi:MAG: FAD-binding oxidoreductase [Lachnospiraceae bacterium]|nr:FAD-binding oxidoreductase [Lachnospiraceae bacterium]